MTDTSTTPIRVIVAGLGNMGLSHAKALEDLPGCEIVALVNRSKVKLPESLAHHTILPDFKAAIAELKPDLCVIATYSDSHADFAIHAMENGAHVFVEKPLATTAEDARRVVECATRLNRKLVVGYILRHHPSWIKLIEEARNLGGPFVFRMNLNQQSSGQTWSTHKQLMNTTPPIVDCGVHYVDVMCQITDARAVEVRGMGLRMSNEIAEDMYNYGHFQVLFDDGSVGWYEAGWGPMMSETAFFVKDVISPAGCVSIVVPEGIKSDDIDTHTKTSLIRIHKSTMDANGAFTKEDQNLSMEDEPGHDELCYREQQFVLNAITQDVDLERHMRDAVASLEICLAADHSVRSGQPVKL
ncbi:Gfo/Idh/MocA family oxidoreductase [Agrobacterium sp. ES01]|uniref:Gfo/Idh/MocA family oxidoreductase n=1 Tax=Agrobacterium sp. ES01 TaxID=3420714 RepID=UPI003D09E393